MSTLFSPTTPLPPAQNPLQGSLYKYISHWQVTNPLEIVKS